MANIRSTRDIVVWSEVREVLHRKIDLAIEQASVAPGMREMGFAQGLLAAYREMLNLPAAMVAGTEMDAAETRNREAVRLSQDPATWRNPHADAIAAAVQKGGEL
jgi:hypothetical protein